MARVFIATQQPMGRRVAVKILHDELRLDREAVGRFHQEVTAVARLRSPHTIQFHDAGESAGAQFIVMELLAGETLRQRLERDGAMPPAEVTAIAAQVAASLQEAHEAGILHRDLKPENVFLCAHPTPLRPFAKVLDFGLAKVLDGDDDPKLTGPRQVVGTPAYMSPERIVRGRAVDHRADVYALGVMCFEMLTGTLPYQESTPMKMALAHATQSIPRASGRRPSLSPAIDAVLRAVLAKNPADRPEDAVTFAAELAAACR